MTSIAAARCSGCAACRVYEISAAADSVAMRAGRVAARGATTVARLYMRACQYSDSKLTAQVCALPAVPPPPGRRCHSPPASALLWCRATGGGRAGLTGGAGRHVRRADAVLPGCAHARGAAPCSVQRAACSASLPPTRRAGLGADCPRPLPCCAGASIGSPPQSKATLSSAPVRMLSPSSNNSPPPLLLPWFSFVQIRATV